MNILWQDIRFGMRMIFKNPGTSLLAMLALAIGIGANSTVFNMVNSMLLSPLPFDDPMKIVRISEKHRERGIQNALASGPNYLDWEKNSKSFDSMCILTSQTYTVIGKGEPKRVSAYLVTTSLARVFGFHIQQGRFFLPSEELLGQDRVVLLSHGLWKQEFGGAPNAVGEKILLDGEAYTIVGILPDSMGMFEGGAKLWLPLSIERIKADRNNRGFAAFARLKPMVSFTQAQAEMDLISANLSQEYPQSNGDWSVIAEPFIQQAFRVLGITYLVLQGAVGFVLLIACSIVASILLARGANRGKEISIRCALGASRIRVIRQMLTESVLLAIGGGLLGLLLTIWGIDGLVSLAPSGLAAWYNRCGVNWTMILFTLILSGMTGIFFGFAPAFQITKQNLNENLKEGGRQSGGTTTSHKILSLLVVCETSLSLILFICSSLMIGSFIRLQNENPGFNSTNLLSLYVDLSGREYQNNHPRVAFYKKCAQQLASLPGVRGLGISNIVPLQGNSGTRFLIEGHDPLPKDQYHSAQIRQINTDYFKVMAIPVLKGRTFQEQDESETNRRILVDECLVGRFFPNQDPIGRRLVLPDFGSDSFEIVGIIGNVKQYGLDGEYLPTIYIPFLQQPATSICFLIRTNNNPSALAAAVQRETQTLDSNLAYQVRTMDQVISETMRYRRFSTVLLIIFSIVALVLSNAGIFGIMAYSTSQRTHEIGIRLALGAGRQDIIRMVVKRGAILTTIGIGIGLVGALVISRILKSMLYGVSTTDPTTYVFVSLIFLMVSLSACWLPARRAAKVDPMTALRCE